MTTRKMSMYLVVVENTEINYDYRAYRRLYSKILT